MEMKKIDSNGFWRIDNNPISKVGIYPYLGKQISPELIPDKIYMVYRPAEELFSDEAIESFNENPVPLINDHTMIGAQFTAPEKKGIDGVINNFRRNGDVLVGDISIFSEDMKSCIEGGKKELSMGYFCNYDLTPGTYNGQHYDAIQRDIRSNHVALVDHGRMGSDVRVYDAFCFDAMDAEFEENEHPRSKDGKFTNKGGAGNNKVTPLFVRSKEGYTANSTIKSNSTKQETNSETKEKYYKEISAERIKKYNGSPRLLLSPQEIDFIKQQANVNQLRSFEDYVGAFWKEYNTNKSTYEAGKHQDDLKKHFDYTKGKLDNLINEIRANKDNIHSADLSTGATDITAKYPKASETIYETKSNSPFQFMEQKDVEQYSKAQQENSKKQRQYFDELREKTAKLDQSLVDSVHEYTDIAYWEINKTLRGEKTQSNMGWSEEEIQKNIRNIKQAMQPLEHDMLLHRGSDMNSIQTIVGEELAGDFSNAKEIKKALEGKTLVSDAFISTSDLINNFNNDAGYNTSKIQWTLKAPKGTKAIDVRSFSEHSWEDEILLDSGSKLKIEKVNFGDGDNGRQIFITASILQSHGTEDAAINFDAIAQDSEESTKTEKTKNHFDDFILRIDKTQTEDAEFEENKHPRSKDGKFTKKGMGEAGAPKANKNSLSQTNENRKARVERARNIGEQNRTLFNNERLSGDYHRFINEENSFLSPSQTSAIKSYTGNEYKKINGVLRGTITNTKTKQSVERQIEQLTQACEHQFKYDQVLYRGTSLEEIAKMLPAELQEKMKKEGVDTKEIAEALVGKTYEAKGFTSTSTQDSFVFINPDKDLGNAIGFKIVAPAGTRGLDLTFHSEHEEQEVLLQRNTKFEITNVTNSDSGFLQVEMTVATPDQITQSDFNKEEIIKKLEDNSESAQTDNLKAMFNRIATDEEGDKIIIEILAKQEVLFEKFVNAEFTDDRLKIIGQQQALASEVRDIEHERSLPYLEQFSLLFQNSLMKKYEDAPKLKKFQKKIKGEVEDIQKLFEQSPTSVAPHIKLNTLLQDKKSFVSDKAWDNVMNYMLGELNTSNKDYNTLKKSIGGDG